MKIYIAILFYGTILFYGCSQSDTNKKTGNEPNQEVITFTPSGSGTGVDSVTNTTTEESNVSTTAVSAEASDKLNPPHGEPGHRCDIAVGSPLNSPPQNAAANNATPVTTAPGMNPPHGEAGHDCTIPVGAPLKK